MRMRPMPSERGFYLIEVMVAVMLTSVGLLGMLALQARSISYAHDSQQRQNAILLAADLARSMQANREGLVREGKLRDDAAFLVAKGSAFPAWAAVRPASPAGSARATGSVASWPAGRRRYSADSSPTTNCSRTPPSSAPPATVNPAPAVRNSPCC